MNYSNYKIFIVKKILYKINFKIRVFFKINYSKMLINNNIYKIHIFNNNLIKYFNHIKRKLLLQKEKFKLTLIWIFIIKHLTINKSKTIKFYSFNRIK